MYFNYASLYMKLSPIFFFWYLRRMQIEKDRGQTNKKVLVQIFNAYTLSIFK